MCHNNAVNALPAPGPYQMRKANGLKYWQYEGEQSGMQKRLAIITDIYGCNPFYQGFATYFAKHGWTVYLIDLFSDLGELKEITREAAFVRRHKLRDHDTCDQLQTFIAEQGIDAVIGFCLGGNFVFELAKRGVNTNLVAFYPFPAGLPNQDEIDAPFEYLETLNKSVTVLVGDSDDSASKENIARLVQIGTGNPVLDVHVYAGSGHGFLEELDSTDEALRTNAEKSLAACMQVIAI